MIEGISQAMGRLPFPMGEALEVWPGTNSPATIAGWTVSVFE